MPDKPDPPYYTRLPDGRSIHICGMPSHSRYWLNVGARLWVCEACHPAVGSVDCQRSVGRREVGEIMEAERVKVE